MFWFVGWVMLFLWFGFVFVGCCCYCLVWFFAGFVGRLVLFLRGCFFFSSVAVCITVSLSGLVVLGG